MNIERIDFAIDCLHAIPETGEFYIGTWGKHAVGHAPEANNFCGTTACAAGWIALNPKAKEHGLFAYWQTKELAEGPSDFLFFSLREEIARYRLDHFSVLANWLDVGYWISTWLFAGSRYLGFQKVTPAHVIARLHWLRERGTLVGVTPETIPADI